MAISHRKIQAEGLSSNTKRKCFAKQIFETPADQGRVLAPKPWRTEMKKLVISLGLVILMTAPALAQISSENAWVFLQPMPKDHATDVGEF
jgi:hypothetical protein